MDPIRRLEEANKQLSIVLEDTTDPTTQSQLEAAQNYLTAAIETLTDNQPE